MEFRALQTRQIDGLLLVIYDWMRFPDPDDIRNLHAYDEEGERLWVAQPRREGDFYTGFVGDSQQLQAFTWDGFCCTLNPATGRIIASVFTK